MDALLFASFKGHTSVVRLLLSRNADPNTKDSKGITALGYAAFYGFQDIALNLIAKGADLWVVFPNPSRTAISGYGQLACPYISEADKEVQRNALIAAYAVGPHKNRSGLLGSALAGAQVGVFQGALFKNIAQWKRPSKYGQAEFDIMAYQNDQLNHLEEIESKRKEEEEKRDKQVIFELAARAK